MPTVQVVNFKVSGGARLRFLLFMPALCNLTMLYILSLLSRT